jgi:predicted metal-dependent hydrolase
MCTERDGVAGVRGHRTMNLSVLIVSTGLWVSCEPLKHHVLNILHSYIPQDEWRFEFLPNRHLIPAF